MRRTRFATLLSLIGGALVALSLLASAQVPTTGAGKGSPSSSAAVWTAGPYVIGDAGSWGITSSAINTTGMKLIAGQLCYYQSSTSIVVTDNQSNVYSYAADAGTGASGVSCQLFYKISPVTGASHTFTFSASGGGNPGYIVQAFTTAGTPTWASQTNFTVDSSGLNSSLATGSITTANPNSLIVTGSVQPGVVSVIPSSGSFVTNPAGNGGYPAALAHYFQPTAGAVNPTWTWSPANINIANVMAFYP